MTGWETDTRFENAAQVVSLQPGVFEITDTGSADSANTIRHQLGRFPQGVRLVRAQLGSTGNATPYHLSGDQWDENAIVLRFPAANARVKLEIF